MIEHDLSGGSTLHAELLPPYAEAEAERIGCGPVKVELPPRPRRPAACGAGDGT